MCVSHECMSVHVSSQELIVSIESGRDILLKGTEIWIYAEKKILWTNFSHVIITKFQWAIHPVWITFNKCPGGILSHVLGGGVKNWFWSKEGVYYG